MSRDTKPQPHSGSTDSLDIGRKRGRKRNNNTEPSVRSLDRGLAILELLAQHSELALTDIAKRLDLANSTAYRLVDTLRLRGFAEQDEHTGQYKLGLKAFEVGSTYAGQQDLAKLAHPYMKALVDELGETVNLAVLTADKASYVHQVEGSHMMRTFVQIGAQVPLYCTGVGKMLVAWQSEAELRELLREETFTALTKHTLTSLEVYLKHLDAVRKRGYALDDEEVEIGVRCLAAPIFDRHGDVVAALSLSAPATRLNDQAIASVANKVSEKTKAISEQLGWQT